MPTKEEMIADIDRIIAERKRKIENLENGTYKLDMTRGLHRLNRKRRRIERTINNDKK